MAITDAAAIKFCNERIRPGADRLARCKFRAEELNTQWTGLGGTWQEKFDLLEPEIRNVGNLLTNTVRFLWWADQVWLGLSLQSVIPDDDTEEVWDDPDNTGQDPTRPPLDGKLVRNNKRRQEEFVNWMRRSTGVTEHWITDFEVTTETLVDEYFRDAMRLTDDSLAPTAGQAKLLADDHCGRIVTEYETTNPAKFTQIIKAAVNPQETV